MTFLLAIAAILAVSILADALFAVPPVRRFYRWVRGR
jgi:hypothetical protein